MSTALHNGVHYTFLYFSEESIIWEKSEGEKLIPKRPKMESNIYLNYVWLWSCHGYWFEGCYFGAITWSGKIAKIKCLWKYLLYSICLVRGCSRESEPWSILWALLLCLAEPRSTRNTGLRWLMMVQRQPLCAMSTF